MRSSQSDARGFVLVVLLVIMAMTAVWMTVSLPAWKHDATREKEAELVFRGQQYVRALALYQRKFGPGATPQSFDVLYDNHFLRKKYKDPITDDDFVPLYRGGTPTAPGQQQPGQSQPGQQPTGPGQGGALMGVASKSTETSIMVYNGATHYNEWQFLFVAPPQGGRGPGGGPAGAGPGRGPAGGPGRGGPGGPAVPGGPGRGGPGGQPQGPGRGGPAGVPTGPGRGRGGS